MRERESDVRMVRDPVCGMRFRAEQAAAKLVVDGREVFFCTEACMQRFRQENASVTESGERTA